MVRIVLDIERRMALSNALIYSSYDVLCLTETWLNSHVPDEALFLGKFELHGADCPSVAKTKHGGVLIAVKQELNQSRCKINIAHDDFICVSIDLAVTVLQICCIYNPPTGSPYRCEVDDLFVLISELMVNETTIGAQGTIIACDLNFSGCDWANQTGTNTYEQSLLDKILENCFVNFLHSLDIKLDVILTNHPEPFLKSYVDQRLTKAYQISDNNCSDHSEFGANLEAHKQPQKIFQESYQLSTKLTVLNSTRIFCLRLFHRTVTAM